MNTQEQNFKTAIADIIFRCSSIGLIVNGFAKAGLTEKQADELQKLSEMAIEVVGLTPNQGKEFDKLNEKVQEGIELTEAQSNKRLDYMERLCTPKKLTNAQYEKIDVLKEKANRPPQLTQGAKTEIENLWLRLEKGFIPEFYDKKMAKGIQGEEDAINLVSYVDGIMYVKNKKRITKGHLTGECDINTSFIDMLFEDQKIDAKVIDDMKMSWNPRTFMNAELNPVYEWQGRGYMYLYDADIFRLRYCLVDCPPEIFADEYKKFCFQNNIIDDSLPEYQAAIAQFKQNYFYEDSDLYSKEERVKTFSFTRDLEKEKNMLAAIDAAVEYYQSITLNQMQR